MDPKRFVFENHRGSEVERTDGPYFWCDREKLGLKPGRYCGDYKDFSEDEVLQISISKTLAKRIKSLKPGNSVYYHRLSSTSSLHIRRLSDTEIVNNRNEEADVVRLKVIREEIRKCIPVVLREEEARLVKKLKAYEKKG